MVLKRILWQRWRTFSGSCSKRFTQSVNFHLRLILSLAGAQAQNVMIIAIYYTEKCITGSRTANALWIFASTFSPGWTEYWDINNVLLATICLLATGCDFFPHCFVMTSSRLMLLPWQLSQVNAVRPTSSPTCRGYAFHFESLIHRKGGKHATPWIPSTFAGQWKKKTPWLLNTVPAWLVTVIKSIRANESFSVCHSLTQHLKHTVGTSGNNGPSHTDSSMHFESTDVVDMTGVL